MARRLNTVLLASVLNILAEVADILATNESSKTIRIAYRHLQAWCLCAEIQVKRLIPSGQTHDVLLQLFNQCSSLIKLGLPPQLSVKSVESSDNELSMFRENWTRVAWKPVSERLEWISQSIDFGPPEQLDGLLDTLINAVNTIKMTYPEESSEWTGDQAPKKTKRAEPSYDVWKAAQSLFGVLLKAKNCSCSPAHQYDARLCLSTHRTSNDLSEDVRFDMFLAMERLWQEVQVETVRESVVQFALNDDGPASGLIKKTMVRKLCGPMHKIRNWRSHRLNFMVEKNQLWATKPEKSNFAVDSAETPISLEEFISTRGSSLTEKTKRIVAVLLGHAALHLHGTQWMRSSWGASNIVFFKASSAIPIRPYLQADLVDDCDVSLHADASSLEDDDDGFPGFPDEDDFFSHPYPHLVTLGIMLMELYLARPFASLAAEISDDDPDTLDNNGRYAIATQAFEKFQHVISFSQQYCVAVDKCLDPNIGFIDGQQLEDDGLRNVIYDEIVRRLEDELEQGKFGNEKLIENLDIEAPKLDLANLGQPIQLQPGHTDPPLKSYGRHARIPSPMHMSKHRSSHSVPPAPLNPMLRLFDDQADEPGAEGTRDFSSEETKSSDRWFGMLRGVHQLIQVNDDPETRVRIAILDTGIDRHHQDMAVDKARILEIRSWLNGAKGAIDKAGDHAGHGTHIAGIILTVAPQADIYVAKIADGNGVTGTEHIAEAIRYAATEWKADIITMSFGFTHRVGSIESAIRAANCLVFAAASNGGGNEGRAHAAKQAEVICVHSTDGQGNPSGFNPTPIKYSDNFSTIGQAIESTWPGKRGECNWERKSGTSFATPVAAGIAAFVLEYARQKIQEPEIRARLRTCEGMEEVFHLMAEERGDYEYLAPWNFFTRENDEYARTSIVKALR